MASVATQVPQVPLDSTLTLVARVRAGDRVALGMLLGRYQPALQRFAHGRMPSPARGLVETADIVQDVLKQLMGRLEHIDLSIPGALIAYLRSAVVNQIRTEIRRARRRPEPVALDERLPALDPDPLEAVIGRQWRERYELALLQLPPDQQEAFVMRVEMDCSHREIADALGRSGEEAARSLVRRAIRAMAAALRDQ
jgi:RNA polymerase sigma-70 factor (ECF subfamily)